jgi:hypothetical protein
LRYFSVTFPDAQARQQVLNRLEAAQIPAEQQDGGFTVKDPWQNVIHLVIEAGNPA